MTKVSSSTAVLVTALLASASLADARPGSDRAKPKSGPRKGKVVRVEASRSSSQPAICQIDNEGTNSVCYGPAPRVDDEIVLLDTERIVARVKVGAVEAVCKGASLWRVTLRGGADLGSPGAIVMGLLRADVQRGAHLVELSSVNLPDRHSNEGWIAFDANGDGQADGIFTSRTCDAIGPTGPMGCLQLWRKGNHGWDMLREDQIFSC